MKKLKMPRGKVTVGKLLIKDGIKSVLDRVLAKADSLDGIIIITRTEEKDGWLTCGLTDAEEVFMLEWLKAVVLKEYIGESEE